MQSFLAIDAGTSSIKLSLFGEDGHLLKTEAARCAVRYPRPEWAEQDPEDWWRAVRSLAPRFEALFRQHRLAAISVSGQTPLAVPVDKTGRALRPAILWLDRRAAPQVDWLRDTIGEATCRAISRNRLDSYFGGVKWLWFRQNEPELFAQTWKILQASSFVTLRLTGQAVIDPSQAGLCSPCFDAEKGIWDADICEKMGLPLELLPEIRPSTAVVGKVTRAAAQACGLPEGTPVVCGGGDFACACLGAGVDRPGRAALMLGTAGNLMFPGAQSSLPDARLLHTWHVTGQPLTFGGVLAGGNLEWFAGLYQAEHPGFAELDQAAEQIAAGSEGLLFLPYLMGERTPVWDPAARGAFVGLTARHTRAHLYRAVLEGVAFAFRQIKDLAGAARLEEIVALDGGARSAVWRQILADVLGAPLRAGGEQSGTALGSAFLAARGAGRVERFEQINDWLEPGSLQQPDAQRQAHYDKLYKVYCQLYPILKEYDKPPNSM